MSLLGRRWTGVPDPLEGTGAGPLILHRMSADGKHVLDEGRVIVQDPEHLPVLEGPKLYKRNGYYYIFAPFGGVGTGSRRQCCVRAISTAHTNIA